MTKYINPFTDFGFKKLFVEESSNNILLSFLNALLKLSSPIIKITIKDPFNLGKTKYDRSLIYDLYCENEKGEKFFVEMQKAEQEYIKDRMVFYSTFPIQDQAIKGKWNFELKAVYCIGILDFTLSDLSNKTYLNEMKIKNQDNAVFYNKYTLITVEIPKFNKAEKELKTMLDKWLYFLKNIDSFEKLPKLFKEKIFKEAIEKTAVANYTQIERKKYEKSLKVMRDEYNIIQTAQKKSRAEGVEIGIKKGEEIGIKKGEEIGIKKGRTEGEEIGIKKGRAEGEEVGIEKTIQIITLIKQGKSNEDISKKMNFGIKQIDKIRKSIK